MGGWEAAGGSGEADRRRCSCRREALGRSREEMVVVMTCGVLRDTSKSLLSSVKLLELADAFHKKPKPAQAQTTVGGPIANKLQ